MKKMILMALFCAVTMSVSAQRVYKANVSGDVTNGYTATQSASGTSFIIECKGMPAASYTTNAKPTTEADLKTDTQNKTVAYKFEVAATDASESSTWADAWSLATDAEGDWRLPTQRELMLIWLMKEALAKFNFGGFTPLAADYYWSATEHNSYNDNAWFVHFGAGYTGFVNKAYTYRVRLVRDIIVP